MKFKRLLSILIVLVMIVSLLPVGTLTAFADGNEYKTVLVGIIEWVYNNYGDDFRVHYWGGGDGPGDATLTYMDRYMDKSLGPSFWNDLPQPFRIYIAKVPADATGFNVWDPNANLWYGSTDGDLNQNDRAFVFEYTGRRYAYYECPVTDINVPQQWEDLAMDVELGLDYAHRTVNLMCGLSTMTMIGRQDRPFRGCFDGCGNVLNFNLENPGESGAAPFRWISDGAVIQNLTVVGDIIGGWHSGGLVGFCQGGTQTNPNLIDNCQIETNIIADGYCGGVVGHGLDSCLVIQNTLYSGIISGAENNCGGFQGWADGNELTVTESLFSGSYTGSGNFDPIAIGYNQHNFNNAYYIEGPIKYSSEGTPASIDMPYDSLAVQSSVLSIPIWIRGETVVTGFNDWYLYTGTEHPINPAVSYNGTTLVQGVDYEWTIEGQPATGVTNKGSYKLSIMGIGDYSGVVDRYITVVPLSLTGQGTEEDPWLISDAADWVRFALNVAGGDSYRGEYVRLTSDIPVSMKVGTVNGGSQEYPFSGVFDGGGCTIYADFNDFDNQGTAPFCYINGATIQNLNVTGTVCGEYHAAGLVGFVKSDEDENQNPLQNRIANCVVDTDVFGGDYVGGIVGHALDSDLEIENCLYTGLLAGVSNNGNTKGALLGWDDSNGTKTITHCCYVMRGNQNTDNLDLVQGLSGQVVLNDCYRTEDVCQLGTRVYQFLPTDFVCGWIDVAGFAFALPCEISNVASVYNCAGGTVNVSPLVEFDGTPLTEGTDYELQIVPVDGAKSLGVSEPGGYQLQINGINGYDGLAIIPFKVGSITWTLDQDANGQMTILHISGRGAMEDLGPYPYDGSGRYDVPENDMGNIATVVIDVGVTAIGDYAFDGFSNLEKVLIPAGMTEIGEYAFTGSSSAFTQLRLPPSLQTIEKGAFSGLGNVTDIWCGRDYQPWQDFLNAPEADLTDNQILTGWNYSWQPVNLYYPVLSSIQTSPTPDGFVRFTVEGADAIQASDGQLVYVISEPNDGYELDELRVSFVENSVPYTFSVKPVTAFTMAFDSPVTVTPIFKAISYSITYQGLAGVNPLPVNPSSYTVNTPTFTLNNPAKTGYVFDGWTLNGSATPVLTATIPQGTIGNLDFTANWTAYTYNVRFDPNGGTGNMPDQGFTYDVLQPLDSNSFTRPGYVFIEWNTMPDGSGTSYTDGQNVMNLTAVNNGLVTLYAQWAPISYFVHFEPNGGTNSMQDQSFTYDVPQNLLPNLITRPCYNFAFWNTMPDGSGLSFMDRERVLNLTTVDNELVTLFAIWDPFHYQVHYEPNGGYGNMPDQSFDYDMPQALDQNAYRFIGYEFQGWNTMPDNSGTFYGDCETVVNLTSVDNGLVTLHAIWNPINYVVQFDPNGGIGNMPDQIHTYDTPQNLDANTFSNLGYAFNGWNTAPDGSGTSYTDCQSVLNLCNTAGDVITLYAQWAGINYSIHYDPNHVNASGTMADQAFVYGTPQALTPNAFSVAGCSFVKWNTMPNGSGIDYSDCDTVTDLTMVSGGVVVLYAQWQPNIYIAHFEPNGGIGNMPDQSFTHGVPQILDPNQFTYPGYDFAGWNDAPDGFGASYAVGVPVSLTGDVVLFAQWTPYTYTVHFDPNTTAWTGTMADQAFTYDAPQALNANAFVLPGYSLDYWCDNPSGSGMTFGDGDIVNILPTTNGATITLYAIWKPNDYTIVFNPNAPTGSYTGTMPSQNFTYDMPQYLFLNTYDRTGYTFQGWNTRPDGLGTTYGNGILMNMPVSAFGQTVVLYAIWQANTYNIHFDPNMGTGPQMPNQSFTYDSPQALIPNTYTMTNYVFVGWCFDIEGYDTIYQDQEIVVNLTAQDGVTLTLYAIWEPIHCTVIFHPNGAPGTDYSQVLYWDQNQALLPNAFVYPGYGFDHWNDLPNNSGGINYLDGATPGNFWSTNGQVIDLYAQWRAAQYTVAFDPNGAPGPWMPDQVFTYGVSAPLNQNQYIRPGYRFDGWKDGYGNLYTDGQTVLNLTDIDGAFIFLEAQWTPYQYTIHFSPNPPDPLNWDGAMLDMNMTYDQGRNLIANAYTSRGYHFSHWDTRINDSGTDYTNRQFVNICPSYDGEVITLYAQWKANTYTVIFDANGGTGSMPNQMFTYNLYGVLNPNTFTRVGYTFIGWNTKADGTGISYADCATVANLTATNNGSVTLYAQWRPNTYTVNFDRNGANLGRMQPQSFTYDVAQALSLNVFIKQDCHFVSWNTDPDGSGTSYQDGESVMNLTPVDGGVVTLYAQWAPGLWEVGSEVVGGSLCYSPAPPCVAGTLVTIEAYPDPGYVLYTISAVYSDEQGMSAALDLERVGEEYMWTFVMPAGDVMINAVFGPPATDGFYLIGPDWTLDAINPANCFAVDSTVEGQYFLQTTLTEGQKIKVVKLVNGVIEAWYPDGFENEYTVDPDHAGEKTIYFREFYYDDWVEFGGYIWIDANTPEPPGPTEPIETTELHIYSSISVGTDMVVTLNARKTDLTNFENFWIEVVKHGPEGDEAYVYSQDELLEGPSTWSVQFRNIYAKEMGVDIEARLYTSDADGQVYMSPVRIANIRDYLGGRLTATNNKVEQRTLAADMLNYGAAAQMFMNYQTDHLVNQELTSEQLVKLHQYETAGLAPVTKTNYNTRPEGQANILFNSVTLGNEVLLNLTVRLPESTEDVKIQVKIHATGQLVTVLYPSFSGSTFWTTFNGIGADAMRTEFDFVTVVGGVETGNIRTWSVEGYVGEIRAESNQTKTNMANALLTYGDSAAAYFAAQ